MTTLYTCDASKIKYKTNRRGVDAYATILCDGKPFANIFDEASAVVAKVDFIDPATESEFLRAAWAAGFTQFSEAYNISEFARKIVADAEIEQENQQLKGK